MLPKRKRKKAKKMSATEAGQERNWELFFGWEGGKLRTFFGDGKYVLVNGLVQKYCMTESQL